MVRVLIWRDCDDGSVVSHIVEFADHIKAATAIDRLKETTWQFVELD